MTDKKGSAPGLMIIIAHPDDAEGSAGGTAALYRKKGRRVKFLSMTNGDTGHHAIGGVELARRRRDEAEKSASIIGAECAVLDIHNNELEPNLFYRKMLVEEIRKFKADIIITHRPYDYHPDHRYTSQLVQDAAGSVHIPNVCPLTPELKRKPVTLHSFDNFRKPVPFCPDIVVDVGPVIKTKLEMWHCHESQMYEWLPYEGGRKGKIPGKAAERKKWLASWRLDRQLLIADKFRDKLIETYGKNRGEKIQYAEAFEISEYGFQIDKRSWKKYFPF